MTASVPPPADDQVREAAVEAVARWLARDHDATWERLNELSRAFFRKDARRLLALPAVSALVDKARADGERDTTVDRLTSADFGWWVEIPSRGAAGWLYEIRDLYGDGYPSRWVVLVADDSQSVAELDFTDSDPTGYPQTMRTPCSVRAAIRQTEGNNR